MNNVRSYDPGLIEEISQASGLGLPPCTIQKLVHVRRVLGDQQAAVALRRGGLYLYALVARRFLLPPTRPGRRKSIRS